MDYRSRYIFQSGQIGLVVLLIGAVLMTVGLGVVSQSVMETKTARQETESSQAFNAAEQGIERALSDALIHGDSGTFGGEGLGYSGSYTVAEQKEFQAAQVSVGHSAEVNLEGGNADAITISWPYTNPCNEDDSEILVTVINAGALTRSGYGCGRTANFITVNGASPICSGNTCTTPPVSVTGYTKVRIKALYRDIISLSVSGNGLPVQSHTVTATVSQDSSGETREVQANKTLPVAPSIFDYALFAGANNLSQ